MTDKTKLIVALILLLVFVGCQGATEGRRDVLIEVVRSMDGVLDEPLDRERTLYSKYCSVCHGPEGRGDGFNAFNLTPRPRNFTDSSFLSQLDTTAIIETIAKGGGAVGLSPTMPPWGRTLRPRDIALLAEYIVRLSDSTGH